MLPSHPTSATSYHCANTPSITDVISEWHMFNVLDKLHATTTDQLPAWFLRLSTPLLYKPSAHLFNMSLTTSFIRRQWKAASICRVEKNPSPSNHSDYRPISITPVLSRIMEHLVVQQFIYRALYCVSKNDTDVAHLNFNAHQPISLIFGTDIAEWVRYQMANCYPTSPN